MTERKHPRFPKGLTYDDVLLQPGHSSVLPHEVDLSTQFTRNLRLKIPLISSAMDTVTEARTAITMAQTGGIGIIHKNLSIENQAKQVKMVKKSEAGMITNPVTIHPKDRLTDVISVMKEVNISGFPVVDEGKLVGILTGRDIRFEKNYNLRVEEIMTKDVITARKGTSSDKAVEILHKHRIEKLPIVDESSNTLVGMFTVKDILKTEQHPNASKDSDGRLLVGAAIGAHGDF